MKKTAAVLSLALLVVLSLTLVSPALAAGDMQCDGPMDTIQSLHHCVQHAYDMGHIDNWGVANSLLAKVDAAQAAMDRGQPSVAIDALQAFVQDVQAQAGKHIVQDHADHMVMHAQMLIDGLGE